MIDFANLPVLIGPRRKRILAERFDREKLARAHMRRAKGPKNHSTNKERSHEQRAKAAAAKKAAAANLEANRQYHEQVAAYWRGELQEHP